MTNVDYYQVTGWMLNELKLSGNDLIIYAIIYGFSRDKKSKFFGSLKYLEKATNASRPTVIKSLKFLVDKKLIQKQSDIKNGITFNYYNANPEFIWSGKETLLPVKKKEIGSKETLLGVVKKLYQGSKETLLNNIDYNILDNKINNTEKEQKTKHLFIDSILYINSKINKEYYYKMMGADYAKFDLDWYFESALNWSESNSNKKVNWIATIKGFIRKDIQEGKARLAQPKQTAKSMNFD